MHDDVDGQVGLVDLLYLLLRQLAVVPFETHRAIGNRVRVQHNTNEVGSRLDLCLLEILLYQVPPDAMLRLQDPLVLLVLVRAHSDQLVLVSVEQLDLGLAVVLRAGAVLQLDLVCEDDGVLVVHPRLLHLDLSHGPDHLLLDVQLFPQEPVHGLAQRLHDLDHALDWPVDVVLLLLNQHPTALRDEQHYLRVYLRVHLDVALAALLVHTVLVQIVQLLLAAAAVLVLRVEQRQAVAEADYLAQSVELCVLTLEEANEIL